MGYLVPPLPEPDGKDILIMLKQLCQQNLYLGIVLGAGFMGAFAIAAILWIAKN